MDWFERMRTCVLSLSKDCAHLTARQSDAADLDQAIVRLAHFVNRSDRETVLAAATSVLRCAAQAVADGRISERRARTIVGLVCVGLNCAADDILNAACAQCAVEERVGVSA